MDRITDFIKKRNIFITGGTGFLGKVLIEKILRQCGNEGGNIYMLIRVKKGKDPRQRIDEIFNSALFESLKKKYPRAIDRMIPICGDVMLADLGMSTEDREILKENVEIVYHCAATIRFDEPLKKAVLLNTRGTKLILELAQSFKKLQCFVHVSTAYCHLQETLLEERFYPATEDPNKIIKCVEWMDEKTVSTMTDRILQTAPNTYAFTKALGEALVVEKKDDLPVIIARPSIVIPVFKEPVPGWTDNINGPTGLLIGAGKGVIRTMWCCDSGYADFIPVDVAANGLILAAWNYVENKEKDKRVFHLTTSSEFKVTWKEIIDLGRKITERVPLNGVVWYPGGSLKNSKIEHLFAKFFLHTIPAYFLDALIFLAGHKPLMVRIQDRISKGMEVFEYYANNQWDFANNNIISFRECMTDTEKDNYCIDGNELDIEKYFETCIHAARVFILKEMPDTLPAAKRHLRRMWWVDKLFKIFFVFMIFYFFYNSSTTVQEFTSSGFNIVRGYIPPAILSSPSSSQL